MVYAAEWISTGELSRAHEKLEGITYCFQCHALTRVIVDEACRQCHEKLNERLKEGKGFHAKVEGKCIECHTEHKGKEHDITGLDKEQFDHGMTGYELLGGHKVACDKCHKNEKTYLDLSPGCLNCHDDIHKQSLSEDCTKCHNYKGWKDLEFDHDRNSEYRLTGKHVDLKCELCHPVSSVKEKTADTEKVYPVLKFKPIQYGKCDDCHYDIHRGEVKDKPCADCHITRGWKERLFDHNDPLMSDYELSGRHENVSCELCHSEAKRVYRKGGEDARIFSLKFKPVTNSFCTDCHFDVHRGEFEDKGCDSCHSLSRPWKEFTFEHEPALEGVSIFEGKHKGVACRKCHESSEIIYTEFNIKKKKLMPGFKLLSSEGDCIDCHKEEHKERFKGVAGGREITCGACHSVENEWKDYGYKHESEVKFKKYQLIYKAEESECEKCHTCGKEVFCVSCCVRRCMPCDFRQKIMKSKDLELYPLKDREP
jgi:hypothetical protein